MTLLFKLLFIITPLQRDNIKLKLPLLKLTLEGKSEQLVNLFTDVGSKEEKWTDG